MYWICGLFFWHDYESKCDRDEIYIRYFFFFLIWRCLVRRQKTFLIRRKRTWASFLSNIKKKLLLHGSHVLSQILMMRSHDLQIFLREPRNGNVKLITEVWNPIHRVTKIRPWPPASTWGSSSLILWQFCLLEIQDNKKTKWKTQNAKYKTQNAYLTISTMQWPGST